jgi:DNA ligase (NAD+)
MLCRNGRLALAATRGDGSQGEDVTHNALTGAIQGLPLTLAASSSSSSSNGDGGGSSLPAEVEVRGEVFMTTSDFEQVRRGGHDLVCSLLLCCHVCVLAC